MAPSLLHTVQTIRQHIGDVQPTVAIVLGSGLGMLANQLTDKNSMDYQQIPGFPKCQVSGHNATLSVGKFQNVTVLCLEGRPHAYAGEMTAIPHFIRTIKALGIKDIFITNASGSLRDDMPLGQLMLIKDHINFQILNPLVGPNDDSVGPRFVAMDKAYNLKLRALLKQEAQTLNIELTEGIYGAMMGPTYETAAEIHACKMLGIDCVGMSTVPEVIVARHAGLKIAAITVLANYATGITKQSHDHKQIVTIAEQAAGDLSLLLFGMIGKHYG